MAYLLYYLIFLPLSKLPMRWLYGLGSGLAFLGWHVIGYRKKVVLDNVRNSFPDWSEREVRAAARGCYGVFFEGIAESIRLFSMSNAEALARLPVENPEAVDHLINQERSFIGVGGHYGNYEIGGLSFPLAFPGLTVMAIYSPLKNEVSNRLATENRSRNGAHMVSRRVVEEYFQADPIRPAIEFFVADQSPSNHAWRKLHWTRFLHRNTSFLAGPERFAVRYDRPVYFMRIRRLARGKYTARLVPITDHPRREAPGFITERFARILESEIQRDPLPWLWTHRRWKRPVPPEVVQRLESEAFLPAEYDPTPRGRASAS